MRFLIGLILLAFPIAEILLLIELGHRYGWWLLFYLVVVTYLGLQLIRGEKQLMSAKMMQSLSAGGNPIKTMLGSARNLVAGVLLIIPGVISDIIAAILLLIPIQQPTVNVNVGAGTQTNFESTYKKSNKPAANDDVIEGEFVEIIEDPKK
ncbi:MAG: FxsA family protein [Methylophilaceae bacterium]